LQAPPADAADASEARNSNGHRGIVSGKEQQRM
jgi:hypothetical protein